MAYAKWGGHERQHNPYNWLGFIGYHHTYTGLHRRGRFGPLSNRKKNWGVYRLAEYMSVKYPDTFIVWRARHKLGVRDAPFR